MYNIEHVKPEDIEKRSFEIIGEELFSRGISLDRDKEFIIKRAIHTTADFEYADTLMFSDAAPVKMAELIRGGAKIVTDTNMALAGINKTALSSFGAAAYCFMAEEEVALESKERGITRAAVSVERAFKSGGRIIYVCGNAPTALIALRDFYDRGIRADFVVGVPVGFVNVVSSKEMIMDTDMPYIINRGRKGGSNVAASIVNAVLYEMKKGNL